MSMGELLLWIFLNHRAWSKEMSSTKKITDMKQIYEFYYYQVNTNTDKHAYSAKRQ